MISVVGAHRRPCNLTHMFWACPKLFEFWQSFLKTVSDILGINLIPTPHIAIFGKAPDDLHATKVQNNVLAFSSLVTRKRILLQWKSLQPPLTKVWLHNILGLLKLEKIKFSLRGTHWRPLPKYFNCLLITTHSMTHINCTSLC